MRETSEAMRYWKTAAMLVGPYDGPLQGKINLVLGTDD